MDGFFFADVYFQCDDSFPEFIDSVMAWGQVGIGHAEKEFFPAVTEHLVLGTEMLDQVLNCCGQYEVTRVVPV